MTGERAERPERMSAQELVERILAEQRAKVVRRVGEHDGCLDEERGDAAGGYRANDGMPHDRAGSSRNRPVYEDEPIIKTGAQFVRDRVQREKCAAQSKAAYVSQAPSEDEASWRELMAYGTIHHAKRTNSKGGPFGAPMAPGASGASSACSVAHDGSQIAQNHRYWPSGPAKGEDSPHSSCQQGHSFAARSDSRSGRVNIDDFVPKPDAAPYRVGRPACRNGIAPRHAGSEAHAAEVPEWRRPARAASLVGFSLEDESGRGFCSGAEPLELPPLLQELRALEREDAAFLKSRDWLFVRQAKLAADYEDDFAYDGTFQHYFPTYQAMDDRQLRGYFSWRTKVRQGNVRKTSLSFAFVHLYELLNGVGAASPEEGFERLRSFVEAYRAEDAHIDRYARTWLHDYVIFHGLDRALLDELDRAGLSAEGEKRSVDEALAVIAAADAGTSGGQEPGAPSDERLFAALCTLSSYRLNESRFYRDDPGLACRAACEVWRALGSYFCKHRKRTLFESLFGRCFEMPYPLFRSAVFYGETRHADVVYEVGPVRRYHCRNGRWSEEAYHQAPSRSKDLGRIMKALDCALRRACESPHQLKPVSVPKYVRDILDGVVGRLFEERRRAEERAQAARVEIDFSKLQGIRAAAATTRDALLIDEERASEGSHAVSTERGIAANGGGQVRAGQDCESVILPGREMAAMERDGAPCRKASPAFAFDGPLPIAPPAPTPSMACGAAILQEGNKLAGAGSATEQASLAPNPAGAESLSLAPNPVGAESPSLAPSPAGLTAEEASYLRCLATGAPAARRAAVLAQTGTMETLMVDAVNEKLYDLLGDIAVEETDEGFALIDDYEDDVRGMLGL